MMLLYTEESISICELCLLEIISSFTVEMELARVHYISEKYRTSQLTEVDLA